MIVKMTILRPLGSSDDKEKIDVARPEEPHLRWYRLADGGRGGAAPHGSQGSALKPLRSKGFEDWRDREETKSKQSRKRYFSITGWTDAKKITYVGALTWSTQGILVSPVEPTLGKLNTSVHWTQKLRQSLYTGWTDVWVLVNVGAIVQRVCFSEFTGQLHSPVKPTQHRLIVRTRNG